jgi:hypothetical protein
MDAGSQAENTGMEDWCWRTGGKWWHWNWGGRMKKNWTKGILCAIALLCAEEGKRGCHPASKEGWQAIAGKNNPLNLTG